MEIRVQDFAAARGVSAEAIRKKLRREPPELVGHVVRRNNATWLDEVAQAYLDESLERLPPVLSDGELVRERDYYRAEVERLQAKLEKVQDSLQVALQEQIRLREDSRLRLEAAEGFLKDSKALTEEKEQEAIAARQEAAEAAQRADQAEEQLAAAQAELDRRDHAGLLARIMKKW